MAKKTNWVATLLIAVGALFILFPLYMTVSIALKTPEELADSVLSLPVGLHVENFAKAIEATNFFKRLKTAHLSQ